MHRVAIPTSLPAGWYIVAPRLETAVLATSDQQVPMGCAMQPIEVKPDDAWFVLVPESARGSGCSPRNPAHCG